MRLIHGTENVDVLRPSVLTLGVFDGLHLGHQLIVKTVVNRARDIGAVPTVITFDPHPRSVLHPESSPPLLQTVEQKIEALRVLGIEQTMVIKFDLEFAQVSAGTFLQNVVCRVLGAKEVYLGRGFSFGHNREGNIGFLREASNRMGFFADEVPEVQLRGQRISSSHVRRLLSQGKVNLARRMLGRPYGVEGIVIDGAHRGRLLGFPTANMLPRNRVTPANGVYVTASLIEGKWHRSVSNIGVRPTFETSESEPSVETFVLNWEGDLYGRPLRVRFLHRIRDELRFESVDDLKRQIARDLETAERFFERKGVRTSLAII